MGSQFNVFSWRLVNRSRYAYITDSTDLRPTIRPPDLRSSLPTLDARRKRKLKDLEDTGPPQDCGPIGLSNNQASYSHQTFCPRCAKIDFSKIVPTAWSTSSVRLGKFSQIGLEPSCPLCNLFSSMVARFADYMSNDDWIFYLCPSYTSRIYGMDWRWKPTIPGIERTVSFSILDEYAYRDVSRISQPVSIRATGWMSPIATSETASRFNARLLKAAFDFKLVRAWLDSLPYKVMYLPKSTTNAVITSYRLRQSYNRSSCI